MQTSSNSNDTLKHIDCLKQQLYSSPGFTERARISLETILNCLQTYRAKETYTTCVYSYQNILDYLNPSSPQLSLITDIIKESGHQTLFDVNVHYSKKDKDQLRSPLYSPGYAPYPLDSPDNNAHYLNGLSSDDVIYLFLSLDRIKLMFSTLSFRIHNVSKMRNVYNDILLNNTYVEDNFLQGQINDYLNDCYGISSVLSTNKDALSPDYTFLDGTNRRLFDIQIIVGTTAKKLADALWEPDKRYALEIGKVQYCDSSKNQSTNDLSDLHKVMRDILFSTRVKSNYEEVRAIAKGKDALAMKEDFIDIPLYPLDLFDSFWIDSTACESEHKEIKEILEGLGVPSGIIE